MQKWVTSVTLITCVTYVAYVRDIVGSVVVKVSLEYHDPWSPISLCSFSNMRKELYILAKLHN